jgi:hypothetical protein
VANITSTHASCGGTSVPGPKQSCTANNLPTRKPRCCATTKTLAAASSRMLQCWNPACTQPWCTLLQGCQQTHVMYMLADLANTCQCWCVGAQLGVTSRLIHDKFTTPDQCGCNFCWPVQRAYKQVLEATLHSLPACARFMHTMTCNSLPTSSNPPAIQHSMPLPIYKR